MWSTKHATRAALMRQRKGRHPRPKTVLERPWTIDEIKLLGTMQDADLAAKLGRTRTAVGNQRCERGIPAFSYRSRPWVTSEILLLGKMPDAELAHRIGRTRRAVEQQRYEMKVTKYRPPQPIPATPRSSTPCPLSWAVATWGGR